MHAELATLYWKSLNMDMPGDADAQYLDLGGNSVGIFVLTESIRKNLDIDLDPSVLLSEKSSLNQLTDHVESLTHV
ncbi:acyl carrier protein [Sessilibacter sp. MAH4]